MPGALLSRTSLFPSFKMIPYESVPIRESTLPSRRIMLQEVIAAEKSIKLKI